MLRQVKILPSGSLAGELEVPPDKSISQRAVILASLCRGTTVVRNFLDGDDSRRAVAVFRQMGVVITQEQRREETVLTVHGNGRHGLTAPREQLYLGNSGTTMRLLAGVLAAQPFDTVLTGDESLSGRPMERVSVPLRRMGADIRGRTHGRREYPPLKIRGAALKAMRFSPPVASAQVKSCVLLAGLYARGTTCVCERERTRDHTERMLSIFRAPIKVRGSTVCLSGGADLRSPKTVVVPGDMSSAAFFLVAASIVPDSRLLLRGVGINPTRNHMLRVLRRMGARIEVHPAKRITSGEPRADIMVSHARLRGVSLDARDTVRCIDELPILCVAACCAGGTTRISGAGELRVKETDRIASLVGNLSALGANIRCFRNTMVIRGGTRLKGAVVDSFGDHRTAMSLSIAALAADGPTTITNVGCVTKSYPGFFNDLERLRAR